MWWRFQVAQEALNVAQAGGNSFLGHGGTNVYTSAQRPLADGVLGGGGAEYYFAWPAGSTAASGGDGIVIVTEYK